MQTATSGSAALALDGERNHYVSLGNQPAFKVEKELTLEVWVNVPNNQPKWIGIVTNAWDTGQTESGYGLLLDGSDGYYFALTPSSSSRIQYLSSGAITCNEWHHLAATYDGAQMKLYVDGVQKATQSIASTGINYSPENDLRIGLYKDDNETYPFKGQIADVRLWSCVRTPEEIQETRHQRLRGNEVGLVGYWPLDEGEGTIAHDKTANANHGTLHGAGTWEKSAGPPLPQSASQPVAATSKSQWIDRYHAMWKVRSGHGLITVWKADTPGSWHFTVDDIHEFSALTKLLHTHKSALYETTPEILTFGDTSGFGLETRKDG